ncbi:MAG: PPE domain-containing protein [Saccharothrix sp.]|nr:PPE domain-containing protein [Saccharothrix sp.]
MPEGHRWSGYSHEELYKKINSGPGPKASHASMERWEGVSAALAEINSELHAGVLGSGAKWEGAAADQARGGMNPLAAWADEARGGAEVMRLSAELQADYIAKARADMPPPVKVTAEDPGVVLSTLTHLVGQQTDHEIQEKVRNAAEQRAREVMTTYASSTTSNVTTLGQFNQPPQLVISTSDVARNDAAGVTPGHGFHGGPRGGGRWGRYGGGRGYTRGGTAPQTRPVAPVNGGASTTVSGSTQTSSTTRPTSAPLGSAQNGTTTLGTGGVIGGSSDGRQQDRRKTAADTTTEQNTQSATEQQQGTGGHRPSGTTVVSSAEFGALATTANAQHVATGSGPTSGVLGAGHQGGGDTVHKRTAPVPVQQAFDPFGGLGAGRADDEEDAEHDGADYLRETDDIYGLGGHISPPVIGESTTR